MRAPRSGCPRNSPRDSAFALRPRPLVGRARRTAADPHWTAAYAPATSDTECSTDGGERGSELRAGVAISPATPANPAAARPSPTCGWIMTRFGTSQSSRARWSFRKRQGEPELAFRRPAAGSPLHSCRGLGGSGCSHRRWLLRHRTRSHQIPLRTIAGPTTWCPIQSGACGLNLVC
jgi:hypothetical protein